LKGIGSPRQFDLFIQFIEKSVHSNNFSSFFEYGFLLLNGFIGNNKEKEATLYFKKSADHQERDETFWFGFSLFEGRGIKRDFHQGLRMMECSKNQKYFPSKLYLSAIPSYYQSVRY
jgi:TPR repeat protein